METIPVTAWEEIPVVIIFTILIIVLGKRFLSDFSRSVEKIEDNHLNAIKMLNDQYLQILNVYDKRWEEQSIQINKVNDAIVKKLERLSTTIERVDRSVKQLNTKFEKHDELERSTTEENHKQDVV